MYIFKQPHIGGEVGCHQDATFLYTEPIRSPASGSPSRTPRSTTAACGRNPAATAGRCASGSSAPATTDDGDGTTFVAARRHAAADAAGRARADRGARRARWSCSHGLLPHWSDVNRSPASRHAYSLHCIDGTAELPGVELAAAPGVDAAALARQVRTARVAVTDAGADSRRAACGRRRRCSTTTSTAALRPATVVELAREYGYKDLPTTDVDELATWFNRGAKRNDLVLYLETFAHTVGVMQHRDAIERVAFECAEDLAADGVVYAEVRMAPELCTEEGLTLDEVMQAILDGFPRGSAGTDLTIYAIATAMRTAARSLEIAELAVRFRDAGVVGFDIAGAEAGYPADPPPRRLPVRDARELPRHHPRRRGVRAAEHLGGGAVVRRRAARPRRAHRRRHQRSAGRRAARPAGRVRPRHADPARAVPDVERQHRCLRVDRRPPDRDAAPAALPGHGEHRQPADERHVDVEGVRAAVGGVRLGPRRLRVDHDQHDEERLRRVPGAAADHQRASSSRATPCCRRSRRLGAV